MVTANNRGYNYMERTHHPYYNYTEITHHPYQWQSGEDENIRLQKLQYYKDNATSVKMKYEK
jgi:hypothetical protein